MSIDEKWARLRELYRQLDLGYAYRLSENEHEELKGLMSELAPSPFDLLPDSGKVPAWASGDYDKSDRLVSGWDYNTGNSH